MTDKRVNQVVDTKYIECLSPRFGMFMLKMEQTRSWHDTGVGYCQRSGDDCKTDCSYREVNFYYPSGAYMGGLDPNPGGCIGHPKESEEWKLKDADTDFFDLEEAEPYCEVEALLIKEINKAWPDFLYKCDPVTGKIIE